jgi:hypothetical protein
MPILKRQKRQKKDNDLANLLANEENPIFQSFYELTKIAKNSGYTDLKIDAKNQGIYFENSKKHKLGSFYKIIAKQKSIKKYKNNLKIYSINILKGFAINSNKELFDHRFECFKNHFEKHFNKSEPHIISIFESIFDYQPEIIKTTDNISQATLEIKDFFHSKGYNIYFINQVLVKKGEYFQPEGVLIAVKNNLKIKNIKVVPAQRIPVWEKFNTSNTHSPEYVLHNGIIFSVQVNKKEIRDIAFQHTCAASSVFERLEQFNRLIEKMDSPLSISGDFNPYGYDTDDGIMGKPLFTDTGAATFTFAMFNILVFILKIFGFSFNHREVRKMKNIAKKEGLKLLRPKLKYNLTTFIIYRNWLTKIIFKYLVGFRLDLCFTPKKIKVNYKIVDSQYKKTYFSDHAGQIIEFKDIKV